MTDEQQERLKQIREIVAGPNYYHEGRFYKSRDDQQFLGDALLLLQETFSLVDSQVAGSDLKDRDDVLAFFGASLKENGDLYIDMKKYHAAHLCQEHSFQPWRRKEIEEKCVICLAQDRENAATSMRSACIEKVRAQAAAHRQIAEGLTDKLLAEIQRVRADECDALVNQLESVTIQEQKRIIKMDQATRLALEANGETITLKQGQIVHVDGLPFELLDDVEAYSATTTIQEQEKQ